MNKLEKIKSLLSPEELEQLAKTADEQEIINEKNGLIEKIGKKIVAKDGRQLLREISREI